MRVAAILMLVVAGCGVQPQVDAVSREPKAVISSKSISRSLSTCFLMDADNDNDIDLEDFTALQACFTGPDTNDVFNLVGQWDVLIDEGWWNWYALVEFFPAGQVLIYSIEGTLYEFDGSHVEFSFEPSVGICPGNTLSFKFDMVNANEMSGTFRCSSTTRSAIALRRP